MEKVKGVSCGGDTLKLLIEDNNGSRFIRIPIVDIWELYKYQPTQHAMDLAVCGTPCEECKGVVFHSSACSVPTRKITNVDSPPGRDCMIKELLSKWLQERQFGGRCAHPQKAGVAWSAEWGA